MYNITTPCTTRCCVWSIVGIIRRWWTWLVSVLNRDRLRVLRTASSNNNRITYHIGHRSALKIELYIKRECEHQLQLLSVCVVSKAKVDYFKRRPRRRTHGTVSEEREIGRC